MHKLRTEYVKGYRNHKYKLCKSCDVKIERKGRQSKYCSECDMDVRNIKKLISGVMRPLRVCYNGYDIDIKIKVRKKYV